MIPPFTVMLGVRWRSDHACPPPASQLENLDELNVAMQESTSALEAAKKELEELTEANKERKRTELQMRDEVIHLRNASAQLTEKRVEQRKELEMAVLQYSEIQATIQAKHQEKVDAKALREAEEASRLEKEKEAKQSKKANKAK